MWGRECAVWRARSLVRSLQFMAFYRARAHRLSPSMLAAHIYGRRMMRARDTPIQRIHNSQKQQSSFHHIIPHPHIMIIILAMIFQIFLLLPPSTCVRDEKFINGVCTPHCVYVPIWPVDRWISRNNVNAIVCIWLGTIRLVLRST